MYQMIHPERRKICAVDIMVWAKDCVADGDIAAEDVDLDDVDSCAKALEDIGVVTFSNTFSEESDWQDSREAALDTMEEREAFQRWEDAEPVIPGEIP